MQKKHLKFALRCFVDAPGNLWRRPGKLFLNLELSSYLSVEGMLEPFRDG